MREDVMKTCHEALAAHVGVHRTYAKGKERFYWDNMYTYISC